MVLQLLAARAAMVSDFIFIFTVVRWWDTQISIKKHRVFERVGAFRMHFYGCVMVVVFKSMRIYMLW